MIKDFSVIDIFCGIGGLTKGFVNEGFDVIAGIDFDKTCKYAYEENNNTKFINKDIDQISPSELNSIFPNEKHKILIGCAPCQPYSIFNRRKSKNENSENQQRWELLYSFSNLIVNTKPEIITMENVPLLKGFQKGKVFNDFVTKLRNEGYHITYDIFNAQDFGVPQRRKRLVLFGSLHGDIKMINPTHKDSEYKTVKEAIGQMPIILDGEMHKKDPLHRARKLTELSKRRIQSTPEGGSWKDWDEEIIAECHKKEGGKSYGSAYGRMSWDKVAPTITTYCIGYNNGRFGHPVQDRPISLREAALLQSFPANYDFIDPEIPFSASNLAKHIGNAVPVLLGQAIAKSIKNHLDEI